jgi:small-conductance mechanosensitive channel
MMASVLALLQMPATPAVETSAESSLDLKSLADFVSLGGVAVSVIVAAMLLLRILDGLVNQLSEGFPQWRMLLNKARALIQFGIYLGGGVTVVLLSFKLKGPVLAFLGGTAAVAMGFALKDLVASLVAGITIMFDRPFQVGDRVDFGGYYGDITSIGLRSVRLQTLDDNTVSIPNSIFLTEMTSCGNYGELDMMVTIAFHVGPEQEARRAREIVREAAITSRYVHLEKDVEVLATQVLIENHVAVKLLLKAYVLDLKFEGAMRTDVTLRVLEAFAENGIRPPAVPVRLPDGPASTDESPR